MGPTTASVLAQRARAPALHPMSFTEDTMNEQSVEVGGLPAEPHDHICALYRGRDERDGLMMPFLKAGLRAGDACLCLATDGEGGELVASLSPEHDVSRLVVTEPRDAHMRTGTFTPEPMLAFLHDWSRSAFEEDNLDFARVVADMSWGLPLVSAPFIDDLTDYETRATEWARSYPQSCVCMYDLDRFGGNVIFAVMRAHPKVWISGVVVENPYYQSVE
ncbi:MEDS domain-containing protein [Nocardia sp. IBHARD005]|uniref:MEDS domain-containing protein n=1 Tax=Nocardia sp. IBHARD005 TaxID=3457765 RepID=UPI0040599F9F